ncbi:MAG: hypothetical protein AB1540_03000 [Bdellovibrionota bacterium]
MSVCVHKTAFNQLAEAPKSVARSKGSASFAVISTQALIVGSATAVVPTSALLMCMIVAVFSLFCCTHNAHAADNPEPGSLDKVKLVQRKCISPVTSRIIRLSTQVRRALARNQSDAMKNEVAGDQSHNELFLEAAEDHQKLGSQDAELKSAKIFDATFSTDPAAESIQTDLAASVPQITEPTQVNSPVKIDRERADSKSYRKGKWMMVYRWGPPSQNRLMVAVRSGEEKVDLLLKRGTVFLFKPRWDPDHYHFGYVDAITWNPKNHLETQVLVKTRGDDDRIRLHYLTHAEILTAAKTKRLRPDSSIGEQRFRRHIEEEHVAIDDKDILTEKHAPPPLPDESYLDDFDDERTAITEVVEVENKRPNSSQAHPEEEGFARDEKGSVIEEEIDIAVDSSFYREVHGRPLENALKRKLSEPGKQLAGKKTQDPSKDPEQLPPRDVKPIKKLHWLARRIQAKRFFGATGLRIFSAANDSEPSAPYLMRNEALGLSWAPYFQFREGKQGEKKFGRVVELAVHENKLYLLAEILSSDGQTKAQRALTAREVVSIDQGGLEGKLALRSMSAFHGGRFPNERFDGSTYFRRPGRLTIEKIEPKDIPQRPLGALVEDENVEYGIQIDQDGNLNLLSDYVAKDFTPGQAKLFEKNKTYAYVVLRSGEFKAVPLNDAADAVPEFSLALAEPVLSIGKFRLTTEGSVAIEPGSKHYPIEQSASEKQEAHYLGVTKTFNDFFPESPIQFPKAQAVLKPESNDTP